jgi:hypothetical protein
MTGVPCTILALKDRHNARNGDSIGSSLSHLPVEVQGPRIQCQTQRAEHKKSRRDHYQHDRLPLFSLFVTLRNTYLHFTRL